MVGTDDEFFKRCVDLGLVKGPLLEVGAAKIEQQAGNICDLARGMHIEPVTGADIAAGHGVDVVCDFGTIDFVHDSKLGTFQTVVIFNVLEHTFDPITVLRNAISCLDQGGWALAVVPTVWPIHNFPRDYARLLPDWFEEFAKRHDMKIAQDAFCWLSQFGMTPVRSGTNGQYEIPSFLNLGRSKSSMKYWRSRIGHRLLDTFGRSHWFGHCAVGVAMGKGA